MFGVAKLSGNGLDACKVCELVDTKPGAAKTEEEGEELFDEIAELIAESNAGFTPEFENYQIWHLFIYWRNVERQIRYLWETRHQAWLKSHWEQ